MDTKQTESASRGKMDTNTSSSDQPGMSAVSELAGATAEVDKVDTKRKADKVEAGKLESNTDSPAKTQGHLLEEQGCSNIFPFAKRLLFTIKWQKDKDELQYDENDAVLTKSGVQTKLLFALTSKAYRDLTENIFTRHGLKVVFFDKAGAYFHTDITKQNIQKPEEAREAVLSALNEAFIGFGSKYVNINDLKQQEQREKFLKLDFPAVKSQHVMIFKRNDSDDLYLVGEEARLKSMLQDIGICGSGEVEVKHTVQERTLNIAVELGLQQCLDQTANITVQKDGVRITCDPLCHQDVLEKLKKFVDNVESAYVQLKDEKHTKLLQTKNKEHVEGILRYLREELKKSNITAFIELEKGKDKLKVYCTGNESVQKACKVLSECFKLLSLTKEESKIIRGILKEGKWTYKCLTLQQKSEETEIVCTADLSEELLSKVIDVRAVTVPPLVGQLLEMHGKEILSVLKEELDLQEVKFALDDLTITIKGRKEKIKEFKQRFPKMYVFEHLCVKAPFSAVMQFEEVLGTLAKSLLCCCETKTADKDKISFDGETATWKICDKDIHISICNCQMKDINTIPKIQLVTNCLFPLEEGTGEANRLHLRDTEPMQYEIGQYITEHEMYEEQDQSVSIGPVVLKLVVRNANYMMDTALLQDGFLQIFGELLRQKCERVALSLDMVSGTYAANEIAVACVKAAYQIENNKKILKIFLQTSSEENAESAMKCVDDVCTDEKYFVWRNKAQRDLFQTLESSEIKIQVAETSIIKQEVDIIVNTVRGNLDFSCGALSRQIAEAAGKRIEEERKNFYKLPLKDREIAITSAGKMRKVKHIFHCVLPDFKKSKVLEDVRKITAECLFYADLKRCSSIAFPAFGTGRLQYPVRDVAQSMFEAADEYVNSAMNPSLQQIVFTVPQGCESLKQAFYLVEKRRKNRLNPRCRIDGYDGLFSPVKCGDKCVRVLIAATEEIRTLPTTAVAVRFTRKTEESQRPKLKFALENPVTDNDMVTIYVRKENLQNDLEDCFKFLLENRVSEVVLHTLDGFSHLLQVQSIITALQKHLTDNGDDLFRNIVITVPRIKIKDLTETLVSSDSKITLGSIIKSARSFFSSTVRWEPCTAEEVVVDIRIVGRKAESCSLVKQKVVDYFKSLKDSEEHQSPAVGNGTSLEYLSEKKTTPGEKDDKNSSDEATGSKQNTAFDVNGHTLEEKERQVSACVNPGITRYLRQANKLQTWIDEVSKDYSIYAEEKAEVVTVSGKLDDIFQFESYLETTFSEDRKASAFKRHSKSGQRGKQQSAKPTDYDSIICFDMGKLRVCILAGDITRMEVDCIVNAANEHMSSEVGVAKAVSLAAGEVYDAECKQKSSKKKLQVGEVETTKAGKLICKEVFQARGPTKIDTKDHTTRLKLLQQTIFTCLSMADEREYSSIAVSSISAGTGGIDKKLCAQEYYRAVEKFSRQATHLQKVYFVDVSESWMRQLADDFSKMVENSVSAASQRAGQEEFTITKADKTKTKIVIVQENLEKQKVSAWVSPEDFGFSGSGAIARSILEMGDDKYKQSHALFRTHRHAEVGDVKHTMVKCSKHFLCDHVFHVVVPGVTAESQDVKKAVGAVLTKASDMDVKSIALPVIGLYDLIPEKELLERCTAYVDAICCHFAQSRSNLTYVVVSCNDAAVAYTVRDIFMKKLALD